MLAAALSACLKPSFGSLPRYMRMQDRFSGQNGRSGDSTSTEGAASAPNVYAAAFNFPDAEDWQKDSLQNAEVCFYKNGNLLFSFPVKSPPDPGRVRIRNGHLWTDETDGNRTRVLCDGKEVFSFDGEEILRGFLFEDGQLHTLGQRPGNNGFAYRTDGKLVFSAPSGSVLGSPSDPEWEGGALAADGGEVYYTYCKSVKADGDTGLQYTVMRGSNKFKSFPVGSMENLYDIRVHGGRVFRVEDHSGKLHFFSGDNDIPVKSSLSSIVSRKIGRIDNTLTMRVISLENKTTRKYWTMDPEKNTLKLDVSAKGAGSVLARDGSAWLLAYTDTYGDIVLSRCSEELREPLTGFTVSSAACLYIDGERWAAALTSAGVGPGQIFSSEGDFPVQLNGYFISVRIE